MMGGCVGFLEHGWMGWYFGKEATAALIRGPHRKVAYPLGSDILISQDIQMIAFLVRDDAPRDNTGPPTLQSAAPFIPEENPLTSGKSMFRWPAARCFGKPVRKERKIRCEATDPSSIIDKQATQRRRRSRASTPRPPSRAAKFGSGTTVRVTKLVAPVMSPVKLLPARVSL
jgi:hypothetical protein